jgi:hypothetical protein
MERTIHCAEKVRRDKTNIISRPRIRAPYFVTIPQYLLPHLD